MAFTNPPRGCVVAAATHHGWPYESTYPYWWELGFPLSVMLVPVIVNQYSRSAGVALTSPWMSTVSPPTASGPHR